MLQPKTAETIEKFTPTDTEPSFPIQSQGTPVITDSDDVTLYCLQSHQPSFQPFIRGIDRLAYCML